MGLAASQARLLTITARLADNELRSQTINNAKMRLATQSAQASEKYVNALNESNMMFQNTMIDGSYQNQLLTFNSLTSYSPYNTQYGLANAAGLALVSEAEANMFVASGGNLEKYLNLHGLEWGTTYFDHVYASELQAAMGEEYGIVFGSIDGSRYGTSTVEEYLKAAYEHYEAYEGSLEYAQYVESSQNFISELRNYNLKFEKWILGEQYAGDGGARLRASQIIENMMTKFDKDTNYVSPARNHHNPENDPNSIGNQIRDEFLDAIDWPNKNIMAYIIKNLSDEFLSNYGAEGLKDLFSESLNTDSPAIKDMNIRATYISGGTYYYIDNTEERFDLNDPESLAAAGYTLVQDPSNPSLYLLQTGEGENAETLFTLKKDATTGNYSVWTGNTTFESDDHLTRYLIEDGHTLVTQTYYKKIEDAYEALIQDIMYEIVESNQIAFDFFSREDSSLVDLGGVISGLDPETQRDEIMDYLRDLLDSGTDNEAFMAKMRHLAYIDELMALFYDTDGARISPEEPSAGLVNLFDMYRVECMISVYGEPKYSWIDKNDTGNTGNPDSKAQWLTNLFERMKRGYRILEDGLASSNEWIEFALKSGLVTVEQVDSSHNWVNIDYKTCAGITEQTDRSALVAKAEAEYNRAMNDIKQKDSIYDLQLKNIDTEHSSLQQEYDSIQKVINKNIERTMKFDQNG